MPVFHDIFLRAYALAADQEKEPKRKNRTGYDPKWPEHALVFDTETRITADQSLTFGVYRLCKRAGNKYKLREEGVFYADDLLAKDLEVLKTHLRTAVPDVKSFPPRFPQLLPLRVHAERVLACDSARRSYLWIESAVRPFALSDSLDERRKGRMVLDDGSVSGRSRKRKLPSHPYHPDR
jgi:hypothetical protein